MVERAATIKHREKIDPRRLSGRQREIEENWAILRKAAEVSSRDFPVLKLSSHEELINKYPNKTWSRSRCFIIGGGPSLKGFDFSRLDNELTIAVNRVHEFIKSPSIIFFIDEDGFYKDLMCREFGREALDKFNDSKAMKIALNISGHKYGRGIYSIPISKNPEMTFDLKDGLYDGGNSGYAALNLAVCLGATTIYLLGFDMKGDGKGKQTWFHSGYKIVGSERSYKKWVEEFNKTIPGLAKHGINVYNLNAESAIRCFEFKKFEEIYSLGSGFEHVPAFDSKLLIKHKYNSLYFEGCIGFGDNFYQRPIIKDLAKSYNKIYLKTSFPEVYWDIPNVEFIYPKGFNLRTQTKHAESLPKETWSDPPKEVDRVRWDQVGPSSARSIQTKYTELEDAEDFDFTFPVKNEWVAAARKLIATLPLEGKELCIVRQPTDRKEWLVPARNPKNEYYQLLLDRYKNEYYFLGLADIKQGEEWFAGKLNGMDKEFNKGEIPLTTILGLLKIADMVITYVSFFMIASIAIRAKCFCIFGGVMAPFHVVRDSFDLCNFAYVAPEPFCDCNEPKHKCNKDIPEERILREFEMLKKSERKIKTVSVGTPPGIGDSYWVLTKMESFKEKNAIDHLKIVVHRDPIHYYTADYLKLMPFIDEVVGMTKHFGEFIKLWGEDAPSCIERDLGGVDYLIDFGGYMWIKGTSLVELHPEYETNYMLPMNLSPASRRHAQEMKERNKGKLVLFYTSAIGNNANWNQNDWKYTDWIELIKMINKHSGICPIAIGAEWDRDYIEVLTKMNGGGIIQDFVGKMDIEHTLSLIKEADLLIGFACGLTIVAACRGTPAVMFYPIRGISTYGGFDASFQYAWAPPETRDSDKYMPLPYGGRDTTPEKIFEMVKKFL